MDAYLIAGLPGAGKSTVAEIIKENTASSTIVDSSIIKEIARERIGDFDSKELAKFAGDLRETMGDEYYMDLVEDRLDRGEYDPYHIIIFDGWRHEAGREKAVRIFDNVTTIWVDRLMKSRLRAMQNRGEYNESNFTKKDLKERDMTELFNIGVKTIKEADNIDIEIENNAGLDDLERQVIYKVFQE